MWAIKNETPYAAERTWVRDKSGAHRWVVAVKATFDLDAGGGVRLSDVQQPPLLAPEYHGDPAASSLCYEADLVLDKPTTDILVDAQACAPKGRPVRMVSVALRVGALSKELCVHGARVFYRGLRGIALSSPAAFAERPIIYEWAYGGTDVLDPDLLNHRMDPRNPVGKGFAVHDRHLVDQVGWSIEYPGGKAAERGPAGFGPIASHWLPRLELAGTYDRGWEATRRPLLPLDYDERFVLCAPADQRPLKHLAGGEQVELVNLTSSGLLRFVLPRLFLAFRTHFGPRLTEHEGKLVTVIIEPQRMRLMMVWQTSISVRPTEVDYLDVTVIRQRASSS